MIVREVLDIAKKNECHIFVDGTRYETAVTVGDSVSLWETRDRWLDNEPADLSFPAAASVSIRGGCAVAKGDDGSNYAIEIYQLSKFPIV